MTNEHDDFNRLKNLEAPSNGAGKQRALNAAMDAFDAQHQVGGKKNSSATQGSADPLRLRSIFNFLKGKTIMDMRIPIGATAVGLLLVPLALHFNSTTGLTGFGLGGNDGVVSVEVPEVLATKKTADDANGVAPQKPVRQESAPQVPAPTVASGVTENPTVVDVEADEAAPRDMLSAPLTSVLAPTVTKEARAQYNAGAAPIANLNGASQSQDQFTSFEENRLFVTQDNPISTFSTDVDTASYAYVRRQLEAGLMPPPQAVRVEEMVNYFDYAYLGPRSGDVPFKQNVEVYPNPWNNGTLLMHIGIKGFEPPRAERQPTNLVFLIDSSGSMQDADKLPLLKRSFGLLLDQMDERDTISIVTYAGAAGTVLEPTKASDKHKILDALDRLDAGGSTAGAAGIDAAYRLAAEVKTDNSNNRIILATDGDFNVGMSDPEALKTLIEKKREEGVFLSVLGFGQGNYNDALMQALAQNGNGNAFYIDSFTEARKVLVDELQGTLTTIAKDVKIQVEFNPATVMEYRLVGYESRALNREDFNNDRVDAGDIGAGHTVTAIYEITPTGSGAAQTDPLRYGTPQTLPDVQNVDEYAFLRLRYKLPDGSVSQLIEEPVKVADTVENFEALPRDFRFGAAVAAFGLKLRGSDQLDGMDYAVIRALAADAKGIDRNGYRGEFLTLVDIAGGLAPGAR